MATATFAAGSPREMVEFGKDKQATFHVIVDLLYQRLSSFREGDLSLLLCHSV